MATESTPKDNLPTPKSQWLPVGYGAEEENE